MSSEEWEALCDGCARCCLLKLEDAETGHVSYTRVVCHLLDQETCQCTKYSERTSLVPSCLVLNPGLVHSLRWLPKTCAYRLRSEGRSLHWWHPLVANDPKVIHELGISVRGKAIPENEIDIGKLEEYIDESLS